MTADATVSIDLTHERTVAMIRKTDKTLSGTTTKVLVAMSGGVDSSAVAAILNRDGFDVMGVTMRHFCFRKGEDPKGGKSCCSLESLEDARRVCEQLGIPHRTIDVERDFQSRVVDDFKGEYLRGRTPNPCIRCNEQIRFPMLLELSREEHAEKIATGHYARIAAPGDNSGVYRLKRGLDRAKDQSYFLWTLGQDALSKTLFPVGELSKAAVRQIAGRLGISVAQKPESQDVCFIPGGDYRDFLYRPGDSHPAFRPGPIVTADGDEVGRHEGVAFFTVGQRRGLGISAEVPLFVLRVDVDSKTVVVGKREELLCDEFEIEESSWVAGVCPAFPLHCDVQIRYGHTAAEAIVEEVDSGRLRVRFEKPQEAITPGQSAVFYDGDVVLGGGIIEGKNPS